MAARRSRVTARPPRAAHAPSADRAWKIGGAHHPERVLDVLGVFGRARAPPPRAPRRLTRIRVAGAQRCGWPRSAVDGRALLLGVAQKSGRCMTTSRLRRRRGPSAAGARGCPWRRSPWACSSSTGRGGAALGPPPREASPRGAPPTRRPRAARRRRRPRAPTRGVDGGTRKKKCAPSSLVNLEMRRRRCRRPGEASPGGRRLGERLAVQSPSTGRSRRCLGLGSRLGSPFSRHLILRRRRRGREEPRRGAWVGWTSSSEAASLRAPTPPPRRPSESRRTASATSSASSRPSCRPPRHDVLQAGRRRGGAPSAAARSRPLDATRLQRVGSSSCCVLGLGVLEGPRRPSRRSQVDRGRQRDHHRAVAHHAGHPRPRRRAPASARALTSSTRLSRSASAGRPPSRAEALFTRTSTSPPSASMAWRTVACVAIRLAQVGLERVRARQVLLQLAAELQQRHPPARGARADPTRRGRLGWLRAVGGSGAVAMRAALRRRRRRRRTRIAVVVVAPRARSPRVWSGGGGRSGSFAPSASRKVAEVARVDGCGCRGCLYFDHKATRTTRAA